MLVVETDVVSKGLDRLLYQFKDSPNYLALSEIYLSLQQEIETICFEVLAQKDINQATGLSLDLIGKIVGQSRGGLTDELYRTAILIKIFINNSRGKIADIQNIVKLLTNSEDVIVFENFPASINLYISGNALTDEQRQIVQLIVSAGVRVGNTLVAGGREPLIPVEVDTTDITGILPEEGLDLPDTRIPVEEIV
jgi:hypothetical protein